MVRTKLDYLLMRDKYMKKSMHFVKIVNNKK